MPRILTNTELENNNAVTVRAIYGEILSLSLRMTKHSNLSFQGQPRDLTVARAAKQIETDIMKDKTARALAVTALVFMGIFIISFPMSFMGTDWLYGVFVYTTAGGGAIALMLLLVLKIDGRGFSITKINNDIEMKKIEKANKALIEEAERKDTDASDNSGKPD